MQAILFRSSPSGERITVRNIPPGRRSISQSTVFHGAGVNHFLTCSGTVHAAQTSSGGTSTTRKSTRGSNCGWRSFHLLLLLQQNRCRVDRGGGPTERAERAVGPSLSSQWCMRIIGECAPREETMPTIPAD